jgi:acetoin utilization deacetylase AcuC-like enzyme
VHDAAHVARIRETAGRAVALDPDTFTSPRTYDAACAAAGAALSAVEQVMDGTSPPRALALVRPPGHHAEPARAMGFCFFNNVAVAAARARALGARRVAIVDYDVHHGNGTQACFYEDPSVLFVSTHQFPFFPGTGAEHEIGAGPGRGFTVNIPLAAGSTDADYERVFDHIVEPVLDQFAPDIVLVSAGFDAHADDPLGGMRLTSEAFGRLTSRLRAVADAHAAGRLVLVTEGGYDLAALAASIREVIGVLGARETPTPPPTMTSATSTPRGDAAIARVLPYVRPYWQL